MIKTLTFINYLGDQLTINLANPFDVGMAITEITGLGPGNADIITTDNATMDGAVYNSSRLSYRNIVITLKLLGTDFNGQSIEATRHNVYKYFPIKKPLWLIFESDKRSAMIQGYVESNEPEIFSDWEKTQISIICPNPYFESLMGTTTNFSGVQPSFEFPFITNVQADVFEMGTQYMEGDIDIYYTGEVETGVNINMSFKDHVAPITIYNVITNESIVVDTAKIESRYGELQLGDKIIISTSRGAKKANLLRDNQVYNIINCLDKNLTWFQLQKGDNIFSYSVEGGQEGGLYDLEMNFTNKILYEGL